MILKAPFPYFGGKSTIADAVWARFGDVSNYVEPFFGSGAVLLARPHPPRTETVNDADGLLANFWRALQADPDAVAHYADWPVSEIDLHARHAWLQSARADVTRMLADPEWYDAKAAGWWVWGMSVSLGGNFYRKFTSAKPRFTMPHGIKAARVGDLREYFRELAERLKDVNILCGDWKRVFTDYTLRQETAVFLDPPYSHDERDKTLYAGRDNDISADVRAWAIEHGDDPQMRIALCGYDTEHEEYMPSGWARHYWRTQGGYGNQGDGRGRANKGRETIWFSPHCMPATLFELCDVEV
jgi:DNA adenine methylase